MPAVARAIMSSTATNRFSNVATMDRLMRMLRRGGSRSTLLSAFALVAIALASIGLYGVVRVRPSHSGDANRRPHGARRATPTDRRMILLKAVASLWSVQLIGASGRVGVSRFVCRFRSSQRARRHLFTVVAFGLVGVAMLALCRARSIARRRLTPRKCCASD